MSHRVSLGCVVLVALATGALGASPARVSAPRLPKATTGESSATAQRALLDKYCVTCHNDRAKTAGLTLQTLDLSNMAASAATWEKVVRKLRSGSMPPPAMPHPDPEAY